MNFDCKNNKTAENNIETSENNTTSEHSLSNNDTSQNIKRTMPNELRFVLLFILIISLSFTYLFQSSLAKYRKQVSGNVNLEIAKWNIKINDEAVDNKKVLTNDIIPTFEGNEYTKDSVLAPGSKGHCDIIIDATDVDVDFTYEISLIVDENNAVSDLKTTGYIINPSDTNQTIIAYDDTTPISGTIVHNTPSTTIRLYFEWYDEADNEMDNQKDTEVAIDENSKIIISASARFSQRKV